MAELGLIFFFAVALILLLWQGSNLAAVFLGAPPVSSQAADFLAQVGDKDKTFLDLGSGAGTVCLAAAPYFRHVYGLEAIPFYYLVSKIRTRGLANVTIIRGNFFTHPWPKTDLIYCYLLPPTLARLAPRLATTKATVISRGFPIPGWPAARVSGPSDRPNYIY